MDILFLFISPWYLVQCREQSKSLLNTCGVELFLKGKSILVFLFLKFCHYFIS